MIIYNGDGIGYDVVPRKVINKIEVDLLEQIKIVENMGCSACQFRIALGIIRYYVGQKDKDI